MNRLPALVAVWIVLAISVQPDRIDAEMVLNPGTVLATNIVTHTPGSSYSIQHAINQNGLSSGYTSGVTDFSSYFASNPTHAESGLDTHFLSQISTTGFVDFDLGQVYALSSIAVWNWQISQGGVGVTNIEVLRSTDAAFTAPVSVGNFGFSINGSALAQLDQFSAPVSTRYVRINLSNTTGTGQIGFGELAFGAVPEPSSFILFSLGMFGLAARRRQRVSSV